MSHENSIIRVLNALTSVSLDDFNDRLKLQKLVFLLREMGFDTGYSFAWYVRGPYSPSLTRMLFSANEQGQLLLEKVELNQDENRLVQTLKEFLQRDIDNPKRLELLASVWYFIRKKAYSQEEKQALIENITRIKSQYARKEVEEAFERIIRFRNS